jgi:hypothetical protein
MAGHTHRTPCIHPSASVASTAVVTGDVVVGPHAHLNGAWIASGRPARLFAPDQHDALWTVHEPLDFPGTVYGVPRGTSMREIMRRQSEAFAPPTDP